MKRIPARLILLLIFFGLSHLALEAKACSCYPQDSIYQEYHEVSAVFVGKVIGSRDAQPNELIEDSTRQSTERIFQFSVSEAFKGVRGSQVDVSVGAVESSCYRSFNTGGTYLVYAFKSGEEPLSTGYCSRTNHFVHAANDVHYIRELLRGVPEPRVYGSVMRLETVAEGDTVSRRATPVVGVKMSIEGEGKRLEVVTDLQGRFRLEDIPDGKYKVRPLIVDRRFKIRYATFEEVTLSSKNPSAYTDRKAVTTNFYVEWDNELTGRILDSEGKPIKGARVVVMLPRDPAPLSLERHESHPPDGGFSFWGLIPGKYLLSVSVTAPFEDKTKPTLFYYPGTSKLVEAERIKVGVNQTINDKGIRLPSGYVVRKIRGVLAWPNGVPVSHGRVMLTGSKNSLSKDDAFDWSGTDELGWFSFEVFVGAEYWIYGESNSSGKGEPIKIKIEDTNEPLKIVIPFPKRIQP